MFVARTQIYIILIMMILKRSTRIYQLLTRQQFSTNKQQPPKHQSSIHKTKGVFMTDMKKFYHITKPQYKRYVYNCALTLLSSAFFMYLPNVFTDIQHLLSLNIDNLPANEIYNQYLFTTAKWVSLFGASILITFQRRFFFMDISNRIGARMRYVFYKKLLQSDLYRNKQHSETYTYKMITAIRAISEFMGQNTFFFIRGICFLAGGLACFFYTQPLLAIISIFGLGGFSMFMRKYNVRVKQLRQLQIKALNNLAQVFSQRISNTKLIKLSNAKSYEHIRFLQELKQLYLKSTKVAKTSGLTIGMMQGLGLTCLFLISVGGAALISFNYSTFSLLKSSTYALYVGLGVRSITNFAIQYAKISAQINNLQSSFKELYKDPQYQGPFPLEVINLKVDELNKVQQENKNKFILPEKFTIKFDNLQFVHPQSCNILPPINWTINSGKFIALVGPSGAGKSTLLHILTTLYLPHKGDLLINDEPFPQNQYFLQQNISYVTQDNMVFSDTFRFNLCYGNQSFDTSDQNLIRCLKMSQAYNFVMAKGGLDAVIKQNASDLSGGQKQKIVIARALVKSPRILIMDQATSNCDYISEQNIFSNIKKMLPNSLVIIVNHKLDLIVEYIDETVDFMQLIKKKQ